VPPAQDQRRVEFQDGLGRLLEARRSTRENAGLPGAARPCAGYLHFLPQPVNQRAALDPVLYRDQRSLRSVKTQDALLALSFVEGSRAAGCVLAVVISGLMRAETVRTSIGRITGQGNRASWPDSLGRDDSAETFRIEL
jgi:hypothetical protein